MQPRQLVGLALAFSMSGAAMAQFSIYSPNGYASTEGATNNTFPWGRGTGAIRFQQISDSANFTAQGVTYPILISGARWRANGSTTSWAGTTYTNVQVAFSTAAVDYLAASATFASNRGPDWTVMHSGNVSFLAGTGTGATVPGPNVVVLNFATPFLYDPTAGDLLYEVGFAANSGGAGTTACDAVSTGPLSTRIYNTTDTTGNALTGTVGLNHSIVVELVYVPAAGLYPNFSATPRTGPTGSVVNFTDQTYTNDPLGVQTWGWDLNGDSIVDSNLQNPSFQYNAEGNYTVSLIVTDTLNPQATETKTNYITIDAVDASFTTSLLSPTLVQFTDTSVGNPTSWAWDFQNDSIIDSVLQNPSFNYPGPGSYTVRLVVADTFSNDTAIVTIGVSILPIPGFGSTFSSATATRGYYFQTPVKFSIVSANVPNESAHPLQNVAIYRLAAAPPAFSGSATGGLAFFSTGQPSGVPIPCSLSFNAGDWVGVLGACGDATTMRNSYATPVGPFASSIFGNPVTLRRMLTQFNLVSSGGTAAYSAEDAAAISRVELGITAATGLPYGTGTPSGAGPAAPTMATTRAPRLGTSAELTVTQTDPTAFGFVLIALGPGNLPLPFGTLLIDIFTYAGSLTMNGGAPMNVGATALSLPVPLDPTLNGAGPINFQNLNLVPGSPNQLSLSNGQEMFLAF